MTKTKTAAKPATVLNMGTGKIERGPKAVAKLVTPDEIKLVPSPELIEALDAEQAEKDAKQADDLVAEHDRANQTVYEQVEAEAKATKAPAKTVAERVAKVKAEKTPKAKVEPKAKAMSAKTAARLAWVQANVGKHTVSDVRNGTGKEVSPWDRATRDSLRQLVTAGLIASETGPPEVFFALASTEAPAAK